MSKDPRIPLTHIVERGERIAEHVKSGREAFFGSTLIQDAVIRNFEVIGEATRRIPKRFREENPSIPWQQLNDFRNALIHRYDGIDLELVWQAASSELAPVIEAVRKSLS